MRVCLLVSRARGSCVMGGRIDVCDVLCVCVCVYVCVSSLC